VALQHLLAFKNYVLEWLLDWHLSP
jgi:hypothetical protein